MIEINWWHIFLFLFGFWIITRIFNWIFDRTFKVIFDKLFAEDKKNGEK